MTAERRGGAGVTVETSAATESATRRRGIAGWIAIAIVLLLVGGVGAALSGIGRWAERDALDPESAGPLGTRALVEILRDQGVEVIVTRDRESAARELSERSATLVLPDAPALSDDAVRALAERATDVVLVEPRSRTISLLLPGAGTGRLRGAACRAAGLRGSGSSAVGAGRTRHPPHSGGSGSIDACYPAEDGFGLLVGGTATARSPSSTAGRSSRTSTSPRTATPPSR